jgi:pimeloyl-ACP methyl ester carboxylesterase
LHNVGVDGGQGLTGWRKLALTTPFVLPALVVALLIGVVALPQPASSDRGRPTRLGPVLLVPGYGGSTAGIAILADRLRAAGRAAFVVEVAGDGRGDLDVQAAVLDRAVRNALFLTRSSTVDIVGYSAGGVIARAWAATHIGTVPARRVITLGSPHHGTDLVGHGTGMAPDACPAACRQLLPGSGFLDRLKHAEYAAAQPDWVSIWTTYDRVVPPESSRLSDAVNFSVQSVCGDLPLMHGDLPRDAVVARLAIAELGVDAADVPTPDVCAAA